ncbi:hypothetical protein GGR56DRAFT_678234 [Xylariaceae sp. FL0804]|nr:hypothetical protein GGR56DRAFT_678234 [Xylariaceae sp. FL0804]
MVQPREDYIRIIFEDDGGDDENQDHDENDEDGDESESEDEDKDENEGEEEDVENEVIFSPLPESPTIHAA